VRLKLAFLACVSAAFLTAFAERSVWDGVYTDAQAQRGAALYKTHCEDCHGEELEGDAESPPLSGGQFKDVWNGSTVGDLFERIRVTMPAIRPGRLTREQVADLVALILKTNDYPPGQMELPRDTPSLKQIRILSARPQ
jgi:S-disulfanyl-L-cysteine oxidoreductase SoxD